MLSIISPYVSNSFAAYPNRDPERRRTSLRRKCLGVASTLKLQRAKVFLADSLNQTLSNGLRCYSVHDP